MKCRVRELSLYVALTGILIVQGCGGGGGGGLPVAFDVDFCLNNGVTLGALQFTVDYDALVGAFQGNTANVTCTDLVEGLSVFNHQQAQRNLLVGLVNTNGFAGPGMIVSCVFERTGAAAPVTGDFTVTVTTAEDAGGIGILPLPPVSVCGVAPS